jgi:hypothetical protein
MNHISTIAGMVGDGTTIDRSSPVQVAGGGSWSKVHVLNQVTLAIKTDGTLWGWGGDTYGQLGQNSVPLNRSSPTQIGSATNWIDVGKAGMAGDTAVASKTDATVWTWGYGPYGSGSTARRSSPVQVSSFPIDPYYSSVALQLLGENTVNSTTIVDTSSYAWSFTPVTGLYNSNNVTAKEGSQTIRFAQAAGAGKYLSTPSNSAFVVGTNGFTFEAWIYCYASASGFYPIFQGSDFPSAANSFYIGLYRITTTPSLDYAIQMSTGTGGSASYLISVAQAWTASTWFHLAITLAPNSGSPTLWVNGTSLGSGLGSWTTFNSTSYQVGGGIYSGSSYGFAASYMDMIRFTPGVVRYTTTFTPPTVAGP